MNRDLFHQYSIMCWFSIDKLHSSPIYWYQQRSKSNIKWPQRSKNKNEYNNNNNDQVLMPVGWCRLHNTRYNFGGRPNTFVPPFFSVNVSHNQTNVTSSPSSYTLISATPILIEYLHSTFYIIRFSHTPVYTYASSMIHHHSNQMWAFNPNRKLLTIQEYWCNSHLTNFPLNLKVPYNCTTSQLLFSLSCSSTLKPPSIFSMTKSHLLSNISITLKNRPKVYKNALLWQVPTINIYILTWLIIINYESSTLCTSFLAKPSKF